VAKYAIQAIIAFALCGGFAWYTYSQQQAGEQRIKEKDAELVAAKKISNSEVERRAEVLAAKQVGTLKEQLARPPAADAPSLKCARVWANSGTGSAGSVSGNAGSGSTPNGGTGQPSVVQETHDYGPEIDKRFEDADAMIRTLQARIKSEVGVCR
jgi:hypothetical protein